MIAEQHFAGRQCLGRRSMQEDAYAFSELPADGGLLIVVADGMGGHAAGNRASELAVRMFVAAVHRPGATLATRMAEALEITNAALAEAIDADPDHLEGMGTTLIAAALTPAGLEWISIGDSPLYLWRDGELRRLNADHSFRPVLREMVARGEVTEDQAAKSPLRNWLRAALIGGEMTLVDASPTPLALHAGDIILACSDGVQTLPDDAVAAALAKSAASDAVEIATSLLRTVLAASHAKQDNATAAILKPSADWLSTTGDHLDDDDTTRPMPVPEAESAAAP